MNQHFLASWLATKREEQGYVNNPLDSGGETNHGITKVVARANGYSGPMRLLPVETARSIAKAQYWDIMRLDGIAELSPPIAAEMFDTGFLCGIGNAGKFFQQGLNMFNRSNREPTDYPEVTEDGVVGPMSVAALRAYLDIRHGNGEAVMLKALNAFQGAYFRDLTRARKKDEEFAFGWFQNRVQI